MRRDFEMSEAQREKLLDACKPVPVMFLTGGMPMFDSPQANANRAWAALGVEMGFEPMSVRPTDKGIRFFSAEAVEGKGDDDRHEISDDSPSILPGVEV